MTYAIERFRAAAQASPAGERRFTAGFLGALSVGFEEYGVLDKTAWDRAIRIATETTERLVAEETGRRVK